jgi:hypothetical protein
MPRTVHKTTYSTAFRQLKGLGAYMAFIKTHGEPRSSVNEWERNLFATYHGTNKGKKITGVVSMLLEDNTHTYFQNLWDTKILQGQLEGTVVLKEIFSGFETIVKNELPAGCLHHSFLNSANNTLCTGNSLMNIGKAVDAAVKKYYAAWLKHSPDGTFPSGTNHNDVLETVRLEVWAERAGIVVMIDDDDDDDDDDNDSLGDIGNNGKDHESLPQSCPTGFLPDYWWTFILLCQFGHHEWDTEVHPFLAVGDDVGPRKVSDGRQAQKDAKKEADAQKRDSEPGRGMSDAQQLVLRHKNEEISTGHIESQIATLFELIKANGVTFTQYQTMGGLDDDCREILEENKLHKKELANLRKQLVDRAVNFQKQSDSSGHSLSTASPTATPLQSVLGKRAVEYCSPVTSFEMSPSVESGSSSSGSSGSSHYSGSSSSTSSSGILIDNTNKSLGGRGKKKNPSQGAGTGETQGELPPRDTALV